MQKVPSLNPRLVTGVLRPWKFRGYFNFQGFSMNKIANIFQGFFINFSSIFYPSLCLANNPNIGLLSLQTVFPFSWTISYVTRLVFLKNCFRKINIIPSQDNKYHVYFPTTLIKKLVQNEAKQITKIKKCV